MGVSREELEQVQAYEPTLRPVARGSRSGRIYAVSVKVKGRRGGERGWVFRTPKSRQVFEVILDVSNIESEIPEAWVVSPPDSRIRHLNIFHGQHCPVLKKSLPKLCWGPDYAAQWGNAPRQHRTLGAAIEYLRQFLNDQNPDSPAR